MPSSSRPPSPYPYASHAGLGALAALILAACGGSDAPPDNNAVAQPGKLIDCAKLAEQATFNFANTTITSAEMVGQGQLQVAGAGTVPQHCLVKGEMNRRTSNADGKEYAIGFEMRLPTDWSGRYFYQANGGVDGNILPATGPTGGGAPLSNALSMGFAVISSDAGHPQPTPFFGVDPQARLDYGYAAVGSLTPMAKSLIKAAYGRGPDRSYIGGCSNGGRHAMVAASRYGDQYDGVLAGAPGMYLPKSAVAQLFKAQQYASIASKTLDSGANAGLPDISSAVTAQEWGLLGQSIVAQCDALDGAEDGMVLDTLACEAKFDLQAHVPTCQGERDGSCLSSDQKRVLQRIFDGAVTPSGQAIYNRFYRDPGVAGSDYANWHYVFTTQRDPGAVSFIFNTPPWKEEDYRATTGLKIALNTDLEAAYQKIFATDGIYTKSAWSFMTPPDETNLAALRGNGGKVLVYHGVADPVFSAASSVDWYERLRSAHGEQTQNFARLFLVPGMNHCRGGMATDQFDAITALVNWVEKGEAPAYITASARGGEQANVANTELPAEWGTRTRPLCPYPQVARYNGSGDMQNAASFTCR